MAVKIMSLIAFQCLLSPKSNFSCMNQLTLRRACAAGVRYFVCVLVALALKCKPSANCACAILLIDGLGYLYAFTRGLPLVARGESDTGWLQ